MSYATMFVFAQDGSHQSAIEYRNAWGLHARIWSVLQGRLGWKGADWMLNGGSKEGSVLWTLHERPDVPADERIVMAMTYDHVWVPSEAVPRVALALRNVARDFPAGGAACHLNVVADDMERAIASGARGVGFWGTSVAENPWEEWLDDGETCRYIGPDDEIAAPITEVVPDLFADATKAA